MNGKTFEAEFVKEHRDDGRNIVTLRKPDGTEMTIGLGVLIVDDRKNVNQKSGENKTETKEHSGVEKRTWTRKNSEAFEAEFVKLEKNDKGRNIVTLRKPDGTEMQPGTGQFQRR